MTLGALETSKRRSQIRAKQTDATFKTQADRFSGINADEIEVKEDLMKTFEDSVFEFYGSREYGFRIDIMVRVRTFSELLWIFN